MYSICNIGKNSLALKILREEKLRSKGFMGWSQPPNDCYGMLFYHNIQHPQSYWMDTVPFDLDCLGFDKDDYLIEIMPLDAFSKTSRYFSVPVRHVVEVRGGWCKDKGIKVGEKLIIRKL